MPEMTCTACRESFEKRTAETERGAKWVAWKCQHCGEWNASTKHKLKAFAWGCYAAFIKDDEMRPDGTCVCVTCQKVFDRRDRRLQAGHFAAGRSRNILFLRDNVHVQCVDCNRFKHSNPEAYWPWMIQHYGMDRINEILRLKHTPGTWAWEDLREVINKYYGHYLNR